MPILAKDRGQGLLPIYLRKNARPTTYSLGPDSGSAPPTKMIEGSGRASAPIQLPCLDRGQGTDERGHWRGPLFSSREPRRVAEEERGAEIVEFAVVLLGLLMLLIGIIWIGRAFNIYQTMTRAAREGARELVLTTCASCGNAPYTAASVRTNFVDPALSSDNLDPAQVSGYAATYVWLDPSATSPQQCGVAISFSYPVKLVIPFTTLNASTVTISTRVQMRMENQPTTCSTGSAVP